MKKFIRNNIKTFMTILITAIIVGSVSVYAANTYLAHDISYTPSNDNFDVNNVEDALNELYINSNKNVLLGETFTINNYNGSRINKTLSLELKKGYYICSAVYGNAGFNTKDYVGQSGQNISISDCDSYSELSNYKNIRGASKSVDNEHYNAIVLSGKSFSCKIDSNKNIKITSNTTNDSDQTTPVGIEVSCTKIDVN